jgi:hypothetical protein
MVMVAAPVVPAALAPVVATPVVVTPQVLTVLGHLLVSHPKGVKVLVAQFNP